jgi:hypothetical protein
VGGERSTFSLNTAVMAIAEGSFGHLDADQVTEQFAAARAELLNGPAGRVTARVRHR